MPFHTLQFPVLRRAESSEAPDFFEGARVQRRHLAGFPPRGQQRSFSFVPDAERVGAFRGRPRKEVVIVIEAEAIGLGRR